MTIISTEIKKKEITSTLLNLLCFSIYILAILLSEELKSGAITGFDLCVYNILPSLFPFFILTDFINDLVTFDHLRDNLFLNKILKVSKNGLAPLLIGNISGFPVGVKAAKDKYENNLLEKNELENLSVIANNPSSAFIISGVGCGLLGDIKIGILLYLSVLISTLITAITFNKEIQKTQNNNIITGQKFNLIHSIKSAGQTCITVASFIIFFSSLIGVLKKYTKNKLVLSIFSSLLEVGSSCCIITENSSFLKKLTLPLISFSLSFSGLSVFMQTFSILPSCISKRNYLLKKFFQGIVSAFITFILINIL